MKKQYMEQYRKLGLNITYYRKERDYTQEELAELLGIGRTHMGNIELARTGVSLDILFRLSDIFNVPVHRFLEFRD